MKILISSIVDLNKTPHNRLHQFIRFLSKNHDITVFCINDWWKSGQTNAKLYTKGLDEHLNNVKIIYLTDKKISPILQEVFSFLTISRYRHEEYDVHINYNTLVSGYYISRRVKPTIYDVADDLPEMIRTSPQIPFLLKPFGALMGSVMFKANIAGSEKITYITQSIQRSYNIRPGKSVFIPNGVDAEHFKKYPPGELKKTLGVNDDFVLGYVGVLREWVDLEPVYRSLRPLADAGIRIKLLIIGEEGQFEKNKAMVKQLGIEDKVVFTGTIPYADVPKYIACMDVCLVPFKNDAVSKNSLPLKLFEYMSCEKPVIATGLPGIVDAVGDMVLYASGPEEYKNNIMKLYENERLRLSMGAEGRDYVKSNYDWGVICSKFEAVLHEVIT